MEKEGVTRVKMFLVITVAYLIFWGPLFFVTLVNWDWDWVDAKKSWAHDVALHVAFVHSFVNPLLFIILHQGCRRATLDLLCCNFSSPPEEDPLLSPTPGYQHSSERLEAAPSFDHDNLEQELEKPGSRSYM